MEKIIKLDESVLSDSDRIALKKNLEELEEYFPEHKTYAMDSLCRKTREKAVRLSKALGYPSVNEYLDAYGFEPIKGSQVYELRKDLGYTPGNEPDLVRIKVYDTISELNRLFPSHVIDIGLQNNYGSLSDALTGLYQWLGYKSLSDMLHAYGFEYRAKAGRRESFDPNEVIDELKKRYPDGIESTISEIREANPDLKIKTMMNRAADLFGMPLNKYLIQQGILKMNTRTEEEKRAAHKEWVTDFKNKKAEEDLAEYERYCQASLQGWKILPQDAEELFQNIKRNRSSLRINNVVKELGIDADSHFRELGVLASDTADNELRVLIQNIAFNDLARELGLVITDDILGIENDPAVIQDRYLSILAEMNDQKESIDPTELVRRTGQPVQMVSLILNNLISKGFIIVDRPNGNSMTLSSPALEYLKEKELAEKEKIKNRKMQKKTSKKEPEKPLVPDGALEKVSYLFEIDGIPFRVNYQPKAQLNRLKEWFMKLKRKESRAMTFERATELHHDRMSNDVPLALILQEQEDDANYVSADEASEKYKDFIKVCILYRQKEVVETALRSALKKKNGTLMNKRVQHLAFTGLAIDYEFHELCAVNETDNVMSLEIRRTTCSSKYLPVYETAKACRELLAEWEGKLEKDW